MLSSEEARAKRSAWQGEDLDLWTSEVSSCLSSSAVLEKLSPAGSSGRTSPEFCHRTKGEPLAPSSGSWKTAGMLSRGECWTLSSSEYPRGGAVCFLSDILCPDAPQEYFLSPTACEGIIRRAERRGRSLPPVLKTALQEAIRSSCAIPDRLAQGGSGPLIQDDLSAMLATSQDQVLFQSNVLPIDTTQVTDPRNGSNPQWGDPCHTMSAQGHTPAVCIGFSAGQSATAGSVAAQDEVAPTLRAAESGTNQVPSVAYAISGNIIGREEKNGGHHLGIEDDGAMFTLTTADRHAVAFAWNSSIGVSAAEEVTPTMSAAHSGEPAVCMADDNAHAGIGINVANTLKCGGSAPIVAANGYIVRRLMPVECERLQGFPDGWTDIYGGETRERIDWGKCPDEFDDPEGYVAFIKNPPTVVETGTPDAPRYKACGNSMAVPVINHIGRRIEAVDSIF